ncbi:MAG: MMPL family transporter [Actinomycetes bacterium]
MSLLLSRTGPTPEAELTPPDRVVQVDHSLFGRWGRLVYRRRRLTLGLTGLLLVVAGVWGTSVFSALGGGGFEDPGSESSKAAAVIDDRFGHLGSDVVVVYSAPAGSTLTVADPAFRSAVQSALATVPAADVSSVSTYWSSGRSPTFVSSDGRTTFAVLQLAGADEQAREDAYKAMADGLVADGLTTLRGGPVPVFVAMNTQVEQDIARAESLSFPLLLVLLVVVFGSLVSASLPLAVGGVAILGAFTVLKVLTLFTDVSIFAVNIVTMLGLGLAIDYALFIVGRFREQLAVGDSVEDAVARTVATAGRTVAFSGLTVAVALGALLLFPMNFLRSMGYGGIAAVLVAMVAALTLLPALLAVLGHRVNRLAMPWSRSRVSSSADPSKGAWARLARAVMRRPLLVAGATVALLAVLGLPFFSVAFGGVDHRALPNGTESRVAMETLNQKFPATSAQPIEVVVTGATQSEVGPYLAQLKALPGATGAQVVASTGSETLIDVSFDGIATSDSARGLVADIRSLNAPDGASTLVAGESARLTDLLSSIGNRLPWAGLYLFVTMFVLLFLAFGSVVLPLKAMVMNVLSLSATFGVLVWGFQEGNLSGLLGFTSTGTLEATQPVLILAMAFGLSMDYEVFLLSRIREEWDRTGDNSLAVERGLQKTGRIITSAALLFVVVVGAFATSGITFIQMIGVGLAVAVLIDATVVRALLVPATMQLLGRWNWWAPGPLARLWERFGVRESDELALPVQAAV